MTDKNKRFVLLSVFDKAYKDKYGQPPVYNKWAEQWAADALIQSYGLDGATEILEYYCSVAQRLDWKYFSNNAEDIRQKMESFRKDLRERSERRAQAKRWLNG